MDNLIYIILLLIIAILLKTRFKISYKEKQKKGKNYEKTVCNHYINKGYIVDKRGGFDDAGIDLIAYKANEILLIQCKNWSTNHKYKIREKEVKEFYGACNFYIEENNIEKDKVLCIYAVSNHEIITPKAKGLFKKHYHNCRFQLIKALS